MSVDQNFRSALNGFSRSDVVNYIEESSIAHEKALRQLRDENEKLRARVSALEKERDALNAELTRAKETPAPEEPEPEAAPAAAPETVPAAAPTAGELAAYRRAEAAERAAKKRAAELCRQVNEVVLNASARFDESGSQVDSLMQDLSISLRRLTTTFTAFKQTFDETSDKLRRTELLDAPDDSAV